MNREALILVMDFIEYELVDWVRREVWKCQGNCKRYRHRDFRKGLLPAICCGVPAKLIDRYSQPVRIEVTEPLQSGAQSPESV